MTPILNFILLGRKEVVFLRYAILYPSVAANKSFDGLLHPLLLFMAGLSALLLVEQFDVFQILYFILELGKNLLLLVSVTLRLPLFIICQHLY